MRGMHKTKPNKRVNLIAGSCVALVESKFSDGGRLPLALGGILEIFA